MSSNPGPADPARFHSLAAYFRARLGGAARKVPLDAGFSCPNRDGTISRAGCLFCNPAGSGTGLLAQGLGLAGQWEFMTSRLRVRYPEAKLLAYLQSYSNTHASIARLGQVLAEISALPGVSGLCIGTRPDCLDVEPDGEGGCARLDLLASFMRQGEGGAGLDFVQLDLGLQSADDAVLARIGRGHDAACFARATRAAAARGLAVCAHLVHGLPGADPDDLARSVNFLNALPVAGVKFHNLLVCRGAGLEALWRNGGRPGGPSGGLSEGYAPPEQGDYVQAVVRALARLRPDICVQRLAADAAPGELLAPDWARDKNATLQGIRAELVRQDTWQGRDGFCPDTMPDWDGLQNGNGQPAAGAGPGEGT
ncbi:MAG: TIGR01212 family radical SAM protein [Proteobacteria bacterium]|nr:TIGR01212 family radical SAM protein [Pseudomonadota bacterium]